MEKRSNLEQFLLFSVIVLLGSHVKTGIRFSLRDKWLFQIYEVEITRVDCTAGVGVLRQVFVSSCVHLFHLLLNFALISFKTRGPRWPCITYRITRLV